MPKKDYRIYLNETTRIVVHFENDKRKILKFVVKLEILINNKWVEIERYDTHHNCVHKDIIGKDKMKKKTVFYDLVNNESGLNMALKDFKENYEIYIWRYLNG